MKASNACLAFSGVKAGVQLPKRAALRPPILSETCINSLICAGVRSRNCMISSWEWSRYCGWVKRWVAGGVS
ncbi:hypothetical protein D3C87_2041900 [compost metagenome]